MAQTRIVGCPNCGLVQRAPAASGFTVLCRRCSSPLEVERWRDTGVALAFAAGTLLLLIPATFEPFLMTTALGASRTSVLPSSAAFLWREGWSLLSAAVMLFTIVFPALRFAALCAVLGALRLGRKPRWLATGFRCANALETWAMLDVFLLASVIAYLRLADSISVRVEIGGACFLGAALLSLLTRAALDEERVWRLIAPGIASANGVDALLCPGCRLALSRGAAASHCPRCGSAVHPPTEGSVVASIALLVAAALLYFPANAYPMATIPMNLTPTPYTVLGGIIDLAEAHFLGLAALVFTASFAIPLLKMIGMTWCNASVLGGSRRRLIAKTRVYRWLDEIGRWSMVDPFTIACTVPLVHYNGLIDGRADAAATPFAAVVILTTLSVKVFDPRLLWNGRERPA